MEERDVSRLRTPLTRSNSRSSLLRNATAVAVLRVMRQHTVSIRIRQHTSAYVSIRQHTYADSLLRDATAEVLRVRVTRQHTSAYVSIRQHTSASVSIPAGEGDGKLLALVA
jgi:hypothetical protein